MASLTGELTDGRAPRPATERQRAYLEQLGAPAAQTEGLDIIAASRLIERLQEQRRQQEPPTEKQLQHLERLGAPKAHIARLTSKAEASQLIEDMLLSPTRQQVLLLGELGATGAQMAALKSKGKAAALIEELQAKRQGA